MSINYDHVKHLEFVQSVVERHARTSFVLKGWSVTVVAAVFLLAVRGAEPWLTMCAGLVPATAFWGLDAFYLWQERRYRALFDAIRTGTRGSADPYTLDASRHAGGVPSWLRTLRSPSIIGFHVPLAITLVLAIILFGAQEYHGTESIL